MKNNDLEAAVLPAGEGLIIHCMKKQAWEKIRSADQFGEEGIARDGFIHCSSVGCFWRVAPNFKDVNDELVLLLIDADRLGVPVKWEDADQCGRAYPHVYGPINREAVVGVLPYRKDEAGTWIKNDELMSMHDR